MRKLFITLAGTMILLNSCGTYTGEGAYAGTGLGAILGSAIGGIAGGPRGSDIGTIVGMAGGAAAGAAIGAQADKKAEEEVHEHYERVQERKARQAGEDVHNYDYQGSTESGFDANNGGDDRLYDFDMAGGSEGYTAARPTTTMPSTSSVEDLAAAYNYDPKLEIVNARFIDDNRDGALSRNETGKIVFEVMNRSGKVAFDVQPSVVEADNNKHIYISPGIRVERIDPGKGIRYTAMVKADKKLRDGKARFCLSVIHGNGKISEVTEFTIPTKK